MKRHRIILGTVALVGVALLAAAPEASAQHRGHRGRSFRAPSVRVYGGAFWPAWGFYGAWGGFYPYAYGPAYGPGYGVAYRDAASLRIQVEPKQTEVFVDGYYAGIADDFDGVFQRLNVEPGEHTLELYLEGHRLVRQELYLGPSRSFKVKHQMEPLAAGEAGEPRPVPPPEAPGAEAAGAASTPARHEPAPIPQGFGVLLIHVQPAEAELWIDGERWPAESGGELSVHLSTGSHRVELRRAGHEPFKALVEIRAGQPSRLEVRLPRTGENG